MKNFRFCYCTWMNNWCWVSIDIENIIVEKEYDIEEKDDKSYSFEYCVSYRDPLLFERILARWVWNDQWVWTPEWVFPE